MPQVVDMSFYRSGRAGANLPGRAAGLEFGQECGQEHVQPLDLDHLERASLGDRGLAVELLGLFDCQAAKILARLLGGRESDKALGDLAHTLKGSARAIGAVGVGAAAEAFELALMGSREARAERLHAVAAAVAAARSDIATLLVRERA